METAGLVLGAIPLVLYACDNYERCLGQVKDYWKYQSTLQTIRTHVFIQGEQLNVTLSGIGLTRPTRQELEDHLSEIYAKAKCDEFMAIIDRMEALLARMMVSLDVDSSGKVCRRKYYWNMTDGSYTAQMDRHCSRKSELGVAKSETKLPSKGASSFY
jgi:hypothetical protein